MNSIPTGLLVVLKFLRRPRTGRVGTRARRIYIHISCVTRCNNMVASAHGACVSANEVPDAMIKSSVFHRVSDAISVMRNIMQ